MLWMPQTSKVRQISVPHAHAAQALLGKGPGRVVRPSAALGPPRGVKLLARTLAFCCGALALAAQWGADRVSARAARSCAAGEG